MLLVSQKFVFIEKKLHNCAQLCENVLHQYWPQFGTNIFGKMFVLLKIEICEQIINKFYIIKNNILNYKNYSNLKLQKYYFNYLNKCR